MRVAATGEMALMWTLFFCPSIFSVFIEADDAELGRAVVRLAEIAIEA